MINKLEGKKNGYQLTPSSTNDDLKEIYRSHGKVNCVIVNKRMAKLLKPNIMGANIITVNNKVPDNVFYLNSVN